MKYLWRRLTGRCISCGKKLKSKQTEEEAVLEINNNAARLTKSLRRWPQTQNCKKCHRLVLEGQLGFVQSLLLIDME